MAQNCSNQGHILAPKMRPKMLRKMGHFSSQLALVDRMRQECQFSIPRQHFLKILAKPFISRNGPIWDLNTAKNCSNQGHNLASKMRPKMLRKWAILVRD